jgi:hypothetical protein
VTEDVLKEKVRKETRLRYKMNQLEDMENKMEPAGTCVVVT